MKKSYVILITIFVTILSLNVSFASTDEEGLADDKEIGNSIIVDTEKIEDFTENIPNTEDNINSTNMGTDTTDLNLNDLIIDMIVNSSYTYYYGDGCPHCEEVDKYLTQTDGYNKLNIVKKEVWNNEANGLEMEEAITRLGLNIKNVGVPFIVIKNGEKESHIGGDKTILEYFKPYLGEAPELNVSKSDVPVSDAPELNENNTTRNIILIVIFVLAIIIPTILVKINSK